LGGDFPEPAYEPTAEELRELDKQRVMSMIRIEK